MPFWKTIKDEITINFVPDDPDDAEPQQVTQPKKKPKQKKVKEQKQVVEEPPEEPEFLDPTGSSCSSRYLYNKYYQILYVLLLCLFLGLLLPFILTSTALKPPSGILDKTGYCFVNDSFKYECRGGNESQSVCESHGCCYTSASSINVPACFHSQPSDYGYAVHNTSIDPLTYVISKDFRRGRLMVTESTSRTLYRLGTAESMTVNLKVRNDRTKTPYDGEMWPAQLVAERKGDDVVRLSLFSPGHDQGAFVKDPTFSPSAATAPKLEVELTQEENGAFNLTVYRNGNKDNPILRTILGPIIMGDGYMEFTTTLPSGRVFGLGHRLRTENSPQFDEYEKWSLNSRDPSLANISLYDTSSNQSVPYASFPGTHPFYMGIEPSGQAHGVYVRTSSPLQIRTIPAPGLSFRSLMGAFKVLVMAGPTPRIVSNQYTDLVGKPSLPPYWALGFHLCRTVSANLQQNAYQSSSDGMTDAMLPFDSDCLDARLTYPDPFGSLPAWTQEAVDELHNSGRKFLAVTYPFVEQGTDTYNEAESGDILMKLPGLTPYFGSIDGKAVGYPDYLDENSYYNWLNGSATARVRFNLSDGAMLLKNSPLNEAVISYDLNEALNQNCSAAFPRTCCRRSGYAFQVDLSMEEVSNGTICWAAVHPSLEGAPHVAHHNAYGMHHTKRVHDVIKSIRPSSRPVLLSSSTHPESGRYGGQFTEGWGVGVSEQRRALRQMLDTGLYGLLMAGAPPCGTRNDTSVDEDSWQQLCLRSYQMSLFFPLLLSHYELNHFPTNPAVASPGLAKQLRPFLMLRYTLLPTLYTLAEEASREGVPPIRPLFYEFPDDERSLNVTDQFLVGSSLLVVPNFEAVFTADTVDVKGYLPPGCWYNLFSGLLVSCHTNGTSVLLPTLFSDVNALLRGGRALFLQGDLHDAVNHTEDSRARDFTVVVAFDNTTTSTGEMYYDDGLTLLDAANYRATRLTAQLTPANRQLRVYRSPVSIDTERYCDDNNLHSSTLKNVIIFGLETVTSVLVDNVAVNSNQVSQDSTSGRLFVGDINFDWCQSASVNVTWTF